MERIPDARYSELIQAGLDLMPECVRSLNLHFFCGTDPVYAGLFDDEKAPDGRSYRDDWCVCYPHHLLKLPKHLRQTTVVMTNLIPDYSLNLRPAIVAHEIAHVLDELLGFRLMFKPVTSYAKTNRGEAFAEAMTAFLALEPYREWYQVEDLTDESRWLLKEARYAIAQA